MKTIAILPAYNEGDKTAKVVAKFPDGAVDEILVVSDGSEDNTVEEIRKVGRATILQNEKRQGIGFAIRQGWEYALKNNYDIVVVMAGNGKDNPEEISRLVKPLKEGYDYVQGSRYIAGGEYGKMPLHRLLFTRGASFLVRSLYGKKITDSTNGFRAYKASLLKDPRVNLYQEWLRETIEYYFSFKILKLDYKVTEAPVTKLYPQGVSYKQYTKIKPFSGWYRRLKTMFFVWAGIWK